MGLYVWRDDLLAGEGGLTVEIILSIAFGICYIVGALVYGRMTGKKGK